jgi:hypothetical protein
MTLLFKQSRETNKETLSVKLEDDQGTMLKIQAGCVSWLVDLLEIRWSSSHFRAHVSPIVQHLVVQNGSSEKYSACKTATNTSEFNFCNQFSELKIRLQSNIAIKSENSSWISSYSVRPRIK